MPSPILAATLQATTLAALSNILAQLLEQWRTETSYQISMPDLLRFIVFTLLTAPPNYLWQVLLERTFPGRTLANPSKTPLPSYEHEEHENLIGEGASLLEPQTKLDWKNTLTKWFIDCMTIGALLNAIAFFVIMGVLKSKSFDEIVFSLKTETFPIIYQSWKLWPVASIVSFTLIPVEKRIVFLSFVGLVWGVFLSLIAAKQ